MTTIVTAAELRRDAQEFLRFKRAMGIVYRRAEFDLDGFVHFVAQHWGDHGEVALEDAISRWCARIHGRKAVTLGNEFGVIRQMCLYRRRRDPSSYVPEHALAPVKESVFLPYIFSHDEVRRLLAAATSHRGRFIGAPMLRALILVLYCTGLRLGEAVRLRMADVDLNRGSLLIRHSKGRSRIVPIRADLVAELCRYAATRQRLVYTHRQADPEMFFLRLDGSALTVHSASDAIRRSLRELGMKPPSGRIGARPYEFRHAFAVHRLTAWASAGVDVDVHARLPWLSAYLGHQNVLGTEVYLKATPELLELASGRFEQHLRRSRRPR
jgi:integrase